MLLKKIAREASAYGAIHYGKKYVLLGSADQHEVCQDICSQMRRDYGMFFVHAWYPNKFKEDPKVIQTAWEESLKFCGGKGDYGLIVFSNDGGIVNAEGTIQSILTRASIRTMLKDGKGERRRQPKSRIDSVMRAHMQMMGEVLKVLPQVVVTRSEDLGEELFKFAGKGTLGVNEHQWEFSRAKRYEFKIIEEIYGINFMLGHFRERTRRELQELCQHHYMLRTGWQNRGSPIGGVSLESYEDGTDELSLLWADEFGLGIGDTVIQHALENSTADKIVALTTNDAARRLFTRNKFGTLGNIRKAIRDRKSEVPKRLREYRTDQRDPTLFILEREADR